MKTLLTILVLAFTVPVVTPGCKTAPSERVVAVQSLKTVGQSAEAAVTLSAQLFRDGKITGAQARAVMDFYDYKWQPAYRLAVSAAQSNLDTLASPDLAILAGQLADLVGKLQPTR